MTKIEMIIRYNILYKYRKVNKLHDVTVIMIIITIFHHALKTNFIDEKVTELKKILYLN